MGQPRYTRTSADKRRSAAARGRWVSLETHDPDGFYVAIMSSEWEACHLVDFFMDLPKESAYRLMNLRKKKGQSNEHWIH